MIVDRRELDFVLFELLDVERLLRHPRFHAYDRGAIRQMLDVAQKIAEQKFLPIAAEVDANEPVIVDGRVEVPACVGAALRDYAEAGFFSLPFSEEAGGLQAPWFLHTAVGGMFSCANASVTNYAFLTVAAANLLFRQFGRIGDRQAPRLGPQVHPAPSLAIVEVRSLHDLVERVTELVDRLLVGETLRRRGLALRLAKLSQFRLQPRVQ